MSIFKFEINDGIVLVVMDDPILPQNVLNESVMTEFENVLTEVEQDQSLSGLVFKSGKAGCFVAGADITMLQKVESVGQAKDMCMQMHGMMQRLTDLPITTVAAIEGSCLGGGLELALCFDYRIASTDKSTKVGLPEVQLGLLPGGGGTQRLPRLIDLPIALDLILTGKQLNVLRATKAGIMDAAVAPEILVKVAEQHAAKSKPLPTKTFRQKLMASAPARKVVFSQALKKTLKTTKGHYPAPVKALDAIERGLATSLTKGLEIEAENFAELVMSAESKQLINIFFAVTELKKDAGVDSNAKPRPVNKVAVLGAGLMGAGISYVSANQANMQVRLKDISAEGLANGIGYAGKLLDKRVARKHMSGNARDRIMARITGTTDYTGFANVDLVIEAVFESLELKQKMIADIESVETAKEIIFATNTSAIPIDDIAATAAHPERVVGMHYFSPVEKMPLLEVIAGKQTADWVIATAVELGKRQGKTVIVVKDGPGFYTTRILVPYLMEAMRLVMGGVAIEEIDKASLKFGFPVGPVKLMDEVGIDVGAHIVENLHQAFGDRIPLIEGMSAALDDDRKGRKNKRGFYDYAGKSKGKEVDQTVYSVLKVANPGSVTLGADEIAERLVLTMLNEAVYCLGEGILRSARDGDIGAIFGLGFPPFHGGPFRYIEALGVNTVVDKLKTLQQQHGERFTPAPLLLEMVESDVTFY